MNVITRTEFELGYFVAIVQYFNHGFRYFYPTPIICQELDDNQVTNDNNL